VHSDQFILWRAFFHVGASFFMPDQPQWPDVDANKIGEIEAAKQAYVRLLEALRQLAADIEVLASSGFPLRKDGAKRASAAQLLHRHASSVIDRFAFVDGEPVNEAHEDLLTAFYAAPFDTVSSRYCWALLSAEGDRASLTNIVAATVEEHRAFLSRQEEKPIKHLDATEHSYVRYADRMAYRSELLRRLVFIDRSLAGSTTATTALENEMERALNDAEDASDILRQLRRARRAK
jgi:hypothetical protein